MTEIALRETGNQLIQSIDDLGRLAKMVADSGMFADCKGDPQKAGVKLLAGLGLGLNPYQALNDLHVVQGKSQMSSTLLGGQIKKSGRYDYRLVTLDDTMCVLRFFDRGEECGTSMFTMDDAKRAKLDGDNWRQYPQAMLYARALSKGARMFCPDVFGGAVYAEGEIQDDGRIPEAPARVPQEITEQIVDVLDATEITEEETA